MSVLDRIARWFGYDKRAATTTDRAGWFVDWAGGGGTSVSGIAVNNDKALTLAVAYACIRNIAEDIAALPLHVYTRDGTARVVQSEHPVTRLLAVSPNPDMTAMSFRTALTGHVLGWGNAYAEIQRNIAGEPVALWPIKPDRVRPFRDSASKAVMYEVSLDDGKRIQLNSRAVLHLAGLGFDGVVGYNVIRYARESIGLGLATEQFGNRFFGNGLHPGVIIKYPHALGEKQRINMRRSLKENHQGLQNAYDGLILEEGGDVVKLAIAPEEAQFLETRKFSVSEICRWFRMPPHKVADLEKASYSNIEEENIWYVINTLTPWMVRWEQEIARKLLGDPAEYVRHNADGLLRGNIKSRYEAYAIGRNWGWLSVNEVREKEDMNPVADGDGRLMPLNMTPLGRQQSESAAGAAHSNDDLLHKMVADCARRIYGADMAELERHAKYAASSPVKWAEWLSAHYERQRAFIVQTLAPLNLGHEVASAITSHRMRLLVESHDAAAVVVSLRILGPAAIEDEIWRHLR